MVESAGGCSVDCYASPIRVLSRVCAFLVSFVEVGYHLCSWCDGCSYLKVGVGRAFVFVGCGQQVRFKDEDYVVLAELVKGGVGVYDALVNVGGGDPQGVW